MRWILLIFISCQPLLASADGSFSAWLYDYLVNGASVKIAIGTRQAGISVERFSDNAEGEIVQRKEDSWFVSYSTRPIYFSPGKTGLTFMFNISGFDADQQKTGNDEYVDLGSRASGRFYYFVPTLFYEWGNYHNGRFVRAGAGLGTGVATFNGNVLLTSTASNESVSISQDRTKVTAASSLMLEAFWRHWGLTIQYASPIYETDEYKISVEDVAINLGYHLVF